jgi:hypothetical protein
VDPPDVNPGGHRSMRNLSLANEMQFQKIRAGAMLQQ